MSDFAPGLTAEEIRFTHDRERLEFDRQVAEAALERSVELLATSQAQLKETLERLRVLSEEQQQRQDAFAKAIEDLFTEVRPSMWGWHTDAEVVK